MVDSHCNWSDTQPLKSMMLCKGTSVILLFKTLDGVFDSAFFVSNSMLVVTDLNN